MYLPRFNGSSMVSGLTRTGVRPLAALLVAASLSACVPVLMGGAVVGTAAVATDRRTAGIQLEDTSIDARIRGAISEHHGDKAQVTPSSYNRKVLLVGTVPDENTRNHIGRLAAAVENVEAVNNLISIGPTRSLSSAANDSLIASQVRAALLATNGLPSSAFSVTTHANVVYLQGRVSRSEGATAARVASKLKGVGKVVTLYEYISEEEARRTSGQPSGSKPGASSSTPAAGQSAAPAPQAGAAASGGGVQVIPIPAAP